MEPACWEVAEPIEDQAQVACRECALSRAVDEPGEQ